MEERQRIEIGQRIKELRNASPQTNRSIADFVGVGERAVANWIAGGGIAWENAKKVAELFEVDPQWLWAGREKGATPDPLAQLNGDRLDRIERRLNQIARALGVPDLPAVEPDDVVHETEEALGELPGDRPEPDEEESGGAESDAEAE